MAQAVKAAPRLKEQLPIRVVPVLTSTMSELPGEGSFAVGVERLLELSEEGKLFVLPDGERELFRELFL